MTKRTDAKIRAYFTWLGSVVLGVASGRIVAQAIGEVWAPHGANFVVWMFGRLARPTYVDEILPFLVMLYGCVALSGMMGAVIATFSRRYGLPVPYGAIAALSALGHAAIISPVGFVIGAGATLTLTIAAVGVAVAFGIVLDHAVTPRGSDGVPGGADPNVVPL